MKNIFKDAYFGKAYKTRDGRKAIYIGDNTYDVGKVSIAYEDSTSAHYIMKDGYYWTTRTETDDDIVSEWQEPIDEKKLNRLANEYCPFHDNDNLETAYFMGFKAGYHKAKSEQV